MRRERAAAVERETELEHMSGAERRFEEESVEDHQADSFADEHLGGINPNRLIEDDDPRHR